MPARGRSTMGPEFVSIAATKSRESGKSMAAKRISKKSDAPEPDDQKQAGSKGDTVEFHYIKSPFFRSVHVDGAIGGVTPRGLIHMAVFSERHAIPRSTVQKLLSTGRLGDEIIDERKGKNGIAREMEVDMFLGLETAKEFVTWLQQRIEIIEAMKGEADGTRSVN
jgi:hypothetical protein